MTVLPVQWLPGAEVPNSLADAVQQNFDALRESGADLGGKSIALRAGVATVTWSGGVPEADSLTVNHGLGRVPLVVVANADQGAPWSVTTVGTFDATTFIVAARTTDGSSPAAATTQTVYWLAVG